MCAELGISDLESKALDALIEYPALAQRIFVYFARRNRSSELLTLFENYCSRGENLHEFVEAQFFEACLFLSPQTTTRNELRRLASRFAQGKSKWQTGRPLARASSILCMYWLGSPTTDLIRLFDQTTARALPKEVARAWLACSAAMAPDDLNQVLHKLMGNTGDDVGRLARFIVLVTSGGIDSIGQYYHQRPRWPGKGQCYDPRAWLVLDLCSHTSNSKLRTRTKHDMVRFAKLAVTWPERSILRRVQRRLK